MTETFKVYRLQAVVTAHIVSIRLKHKASALKCPYFMTAANISHSITLKFVDWFPTTQANIIIGRIIFMPALNWTNECCKPSQKCCLLYVFCHMFLSSGSSNASRDRFPFLVHSSVQIFIRKFLIRHLETSGLTINFQSPVNHLRDMFTFFSSLLYLNRMLTCPYGHWKWSFLKVTAM